jgi:hypothetical protein
MRPNWYCAVVLFGGAVLQPCIAQAADPQPYRVQLQSTGNGALDSTLKATSQLVALRVSVPVDPFGLIARARGDLDRLNTVLQSFGYYQSAVSIAIEGLALDTPTLSDTLSALPKGKDAVCKISFNLGPLYHSVASRSRDRRRILHAAALGSPPGPRRSLPTSWRAARDC